MVYPLGRHTILSLARLWMRKIIGLNNVPKDLGVIVACNHGGFFDDAVLPCAIISGLNRYIHIYVNNRFFKKPFFKMILKWGKGIPIEVGKKKPTRTNKKAFKDAINYLKKGEIVGIFPEGHRSYPGSMRKGKTGVAKLALSAKVPVVPMGIKGSREILPRGKFLPRLKRCTVRIGKPIYFEQYYGKEHNKKVLRLVTDNIMKKIAKLANDKYNY